MRKVNVTELRSHLPEYVHAVQKGAEIGITLHGKVVALIVPPTDTQKAAKLFLKSLQKSAVIGDIISPIDEKWDAQS